MDTDASARFATVADRYAAQIQALLNFQAERAIIAAEEAARQRSAEQKARAVADAAHQTDALTPNATPPIARSDAEHNDAPRLPASASSSNASVEISQSDPAPVRMDADYTVTQATVLDLVC